MNFSGHYKSAWTAFSSYFGSYFWMYLSIFIERGGTPGHKFRNVLEIHVYLFPQPKED